MSLDYIRSYYNVPARLGTRVIADGNRGEIRGARDQYLSLLIEGDARLTIWHPTWHMVYLP